MYPPPQNPTMDFQGAYCNQIPVQMYPVQTGPPAYVSQSSLGSQTVISGQSTAIMEPQTTYKDYMGCSIANLLCCCLPLGAVALVFSFKTRDDMRRGDMISAASDSRWAFTLNMMALVLGLLGNLAWITYTIYLISIPSVPSVSYNVEYPTFTNIHPFPMS